MLKFNPNVTVYGDKAFKEVTEVKWGHKVQNDWCPHKEREIPAMCAHREKPCENTVRRRLSANQEERLRRNQTCQHLDCGIPASRTVQKINF